MSASAPSGSGRRERRAAAAALRSLEPACTAYGLAKSARKGVANPAETPAVEAAPMSVTLIRTFAMGVVETLVHTERRLRLWLYRWAGSLHRRTSRGWGPVARWLAI